MRVSVDIKLSKHGVPEHLKDDVLQSVRWALTVRHEVPSDCLPDGIGAHVPVRVDTNATWATGDHGRHLVLVRLPDCWLRDCPAIGSQTPAQAAEARRQLAVAERERISRLVLRTVVGAQSECVDTLQRLAAVKAAVHLAAQRALPDASTFAINLYRSGDGYSAEAFTHKAAWATTMVRGDALRVARILEGDERELANIVDDYDDEWIEEEDPAGQVVQL